VVARILVPTGVVLLLAGLGVALWPDRLEWNGHRFPFVVEEGAEVLARFDPTWTGRCRLVLRVESDPRQRPSVLHEYLVPWSVSRGDERILGGHETIRSRGPAGDFRRFFDVEQGRRYTLRARVTHAVGGRRPAAFVVEPMASRRLMWRRTLGCAAAFAGVALGLVGVALGQARDRRRRRIDGVAGAFD